MSDPKPSSPITAHNWALVARHLDIRSCLTLMSTCHELHHNLAWHLPKWHFKDQCQCRNVTELDFATGAFGNNEAWLIERFFGFARLGLRFDARLPLLFRMREDPRMHSTVRLVVPRRQDLVAAMAPITSTGSSTGSSSATATAPALNGSGVSMTSTSTGGNDDFEHCDDEHVAQDTKMQEGTEHSAVRGPAAVSWAVFVEDDEQAEQLRRKLAAVARVTTMDKLSVYVCGAITRLVVRDVQELALYSFSSTARISRLQTSNVNALRLEGELQQATLSGECHGLQNAKIVSCNTLTSAPALAQAHNIHLHLAQYLVDLPQFRSVHTLALSTMSGSVDLHIPESVRHLSIDAGGDFRGGTIELPHVEKLEMTSISFEEPAELHCPKATRVTVKSASALSRVVPAPHLQQLTTAANHLPHIEAEQVQDLHVVLLAQKGRRGEALSTETTAACRAIEAWRPRVRGTLTVTVKAFVCSLTLTEPLSVEAATSQFLDAVSSRVASGLRELEAVAVNYGLNSGRRVASVAPFWRVDFPRFGAHGVQRLQLAGTNADGWVVQGVVEVKLDNCVGRLTVRGAKRVQVSSISGKGLVLTVADSGELDVRGGGMLAKLSHVQRCFVKGPGEGGMHIGQVDGVHRLELDSCNLANTTVKDVAKYGCDVLKVLHLQLPSQQLEVISAFMYGRTVKERAAKMRSRAAKMHGVHVWTATERRHRSFRRHPRL